MTENIPQSNVPQPEGSHPQGEQPAAPAANQAPNPAPQEAITQRIAAQPAESAAQPTAPQSAQPTAPQPAQPAVPVPPAPYGHPVPPAYQTAAHPVPAAQQNATHPAHPAHPASAPHNPYSASTPYSAAGLPPAGPYATQTPDGPRKKRTWIPVVGAAAIAAVVASVGTAGLTNVFGQDTSPSSISSLGQTSPSTDKETESGSVPVASSTSENPDWQKVTGAVAKSVVSIAVQLTNGEAEGSGVVINKDGDILTNNHVVAGAQGDVQVTLNDGRLFKAKILGTDPTTDLAVIQLKDAPDDLSPAVLGDSDKVEVGSSVLAVGNPLGLANTATTGIVSALDRPVAAGGEDGSDAVVTNAIQIDAAINHGNSGGPLFNAQGEVIGITSSIASDSSVGLGFAIPSNLAKTISQQLIEDGTAEHAFLGVTLNDGTATADGVTRRGAQVQDITDGSPAAKAGVKSGDVIVAIDDQPVNGAESLTAFVRERGAGDVAKLTLVRDGKSVDVEATLAVKADDPTQGQSDQGGQQLPGNGDQGGQGGQQQLPGNGQQQLPGNGQQLPGDQNQGGGDQTNPNNIPNPFGWFFGQG